MPLLDEYYARRDNPPQDLAKRILFTIMDDILDRKRFDNAWDNFDDEVREEIFTSNLAAIQNEIAKV
jgi:hypothetical protein